MITNYNVDQIATKAILGNPKNENNYKINVSKEVLERVKSRIMTISFDCTPNWGIHGVVDSSINTQKGNWYFQDVYAKEVAIERYNNIDISKLRLIVNEIVKDVVDGKEEVSGFSVYGSYFYRRNALLPEDLDMLIIVKNSQNFAIDAMKYPSEELRSVFINKSKRIPSSQEIGYSIVSEDSFNKDNKSYIVTDCALLDVSTTFSEGKTVSAEPIPPFIIIENAKKIIKWGIASILSKPFSLLSRIDEAIRMRNMVINNFGEIGLNKFAFDEMLPSKKDILLSINDIQLLEISRGLINILDDDERKIREYVISKTIQKC